uniref:Uncharacterized protein n=1 Tax=Knipowitschia caucasica TaxID=637954 RepID=A0AAV2KQE5_KNICA
MDCRCGNGDCRCGNGDCRCGNGDCRCGNGDCRCGNGNCRCASLVVALGCMPVSTAFVVTSAASPDVLEASAMDFVGFKACIWEGVDVVVDFVDFDTILDGFVVDFKGLLVDLADWNDLGVVALATGLLKVSVVVVDNVVVSGVGRGDVVFVVVSAAAVGSDVVWLRPVVDVTFVNQNKAEMAYEALGVVCCHSGEESGTPAVNCSFWTPGGATEDNVVLAEVVLEPTGGFIPEEKIRNM